MNERTNLTTERTEITEEKKLNFILFSVSSVFSVVKNK
jgi:hypothetical protein